MREWHFKKDNWGVKKNDTLRRINGKLRKKDQPSLNHFSGFVEGIRVKKHGKKTDPYINYIITAKRKRKKNCETKMPISV